MKQDEAEKLAREVRPEDLRDFPQEVDAQQLRDLCDYILSGDMKREIENAAYERVAKIFDERAALHAKDATWIGSGLERYEGPRIDGVLMSPMNGPAISHDRERTNATVIRALIQPPAQKENGE